MHDHSRLFLSLTDFGGFQQERRRRGGGSQRPPEMDVIEGSGIAGRMLAVGYVPARWMGDHSRARGRQCEDG